MDTLDLVVIGAGPAGYVAAIRAAQLGLSTACVDDYIGKDGAFVLGGTCLNAGCIPSKALLDSSDQYHRLKYRLAEHGIAIDHVGLDLHKMIGRKNEIVRNLTHSVEELFRKHGVTWYKGHGELVDPVHIKVAHPAGEGEEEVLTARNILLATGSSPRELPHVPIDHERIVDTRDALDFEAVPERLGIIGAGVIGVELGSVWKRLGSDVVLLEAMDQFLLFVDEEIAEHARGAFAAQGLDIRLGARVLSARPADDLVAVHFLDEKGEQTLEVDKLIVAVGRRPHTRGLNLEGVGVLTDESGTILVDAHCRTNLPSIFAVGDVVRGPMLAHKGSEEGIMVVERIAGLKTEVNYDAIPWVIYTSPEIAWVGRTEKELKAAARAYNVGTFPLRNNERAQAMSDREGLVKILADRETDQLLGVHIFAATAAEMIAEAVVAMEFDASAEDIARTVHAHPSLSESIKEAALAVDHRAIHL